VIIMSFTPKTIHQISFGLFSPDDIRKMSVVEISTADTYDEEGYPIDKGLMDPHLGVIDPGIRCRTCGGGLKECLGHPGSIDLARPVIHLKYVPMIELGLRCFCKECKMLMISEKDFSKYPPSQRIKKAKDVKKCPHCNTPQEKIKLDKPTTFYRGKTRIFPKD